MTGTWPAMTSWSAGALPLYAPWTNRVRDEVQALYAHGLRWFEGRAGDPARPG
jgi:hypothetical protein